MPSLAFTDYQKRFLKVDLPRLTPKDKNGYNKKCSTSRRKLSNRLLTPTMCWWIKGLTFESDYYMECVWDVYQELKNDHPNKRITMIMIRKGLIKELKERPLPDLLDLVISEHNGRFKKYPRLAHDLLLASKAALGELVLLYRDCEEQRIKSTWTKSRWNVAIRRILRADA